MSILLDTNVLLRYVSAIHPQHDLTYRVVLRLRRQRQRLCTSPQNCIEFWNVSTRPVDRNGFGKTPAEALQLLRGVEQLFPVISDSPAIYAIWRQLVVAHNVSGVQVHDARLAAAMLANGLTHILTFNVTDFTRYGEAGIVVVDPNTL